MKQLIIILSIILGIVLLGVAGLFTWNQYEKNQIKKIEIKNQKKESEEKTKEQKKVEKKSSSKEKNSNNSQNKNVNKTEDDTTETQTDINNNHNGEGIVSSDEMTTEQEQLAKEGKFQPSIPLEEQASQRPDPNTMSDDEFLDAYKEGMPSDEGETVDELAEDPNYIDYLRGQVEAREKGQGGTY